MTEKNYKISASLTKLGVVEPIINELELLQATCEVLGWDVAATHLHKASGAIQTSLCSKGYGKKHLY